MIDLRTLDIMFNHDELRPDLLHSLVWLTEGSQQTKSQGPDSPKGKSPKGSKQFDVVIEYNRSMEIWYKEENPSSSKISMMCDFIADFLEWYSKKISNIMDSSPFIRDSIDNVHVKQLGLDKKYDEGRLTCLSSDGRHSKTLVHYSPRKEPMYFFNRWFWIQFPWMCLEEASRVCVRPNAVPNVELARKSLSPQEFFSSSRESTINDDDQPCRLSLRAKAMARVSATLPSVNLGKADKIGLVIGKKKVQTKTTSLAKEREEDMDNDAEIGDDSNLNQAYARLSELREIHDSLVVEATEKDKYLVELCENIENSIASHGESLKSIETKRSMLEKLQTRLEKIQDLVKKASEVDNVYTHILSVSQLHDPSDKKLHLELEQQIALSERQISNFLRDEDDMAKEIGSIEAALKDNGNKLKKVAFRRRQLEAKKNDIVERQRAQQRATPDEDIYSKFYTTEAKAIPQTTQILPLQYENSTRRMPINKKIVQQALKSKTELHPFKKLADAAGTTNLDVLVEKIKQDETLEVELRATQEKVELRLKDRLSKLDSIEKEINDLQLVDHGSFFFQPAASVDRDILRLESQSLSIQKQVSSLSKLNENIIFTLKNIGIDRLKDGGTNSTTTGVTYDSDAADLCTQAVTNCIDAIKRIFNEFGLENAKNDIGNGDINLNVEQTECETTRSSTDGTTQFPEY